MGVLEREYLTLFAWWVEPDLNKTNLLNIRERIHTPLRIDGAVVVEFNIHRSHFILITIMLLGQTGKYEQYKISNPERDIVN